MENFEDTGCIITKLFVHMKFRPCESLHLVHAVFLKKKKGFSEIYYTEIESIKFSFSDYKNTP